MGEHVRTGLDDEPTTAPEIAAVLADDALVEAIGSGALTAADAPGEVAALLVAWRDGVDAGPVPVHPDLDAAVQALREGARSHRWHVPLRVLSPVAAAAAAVGIALTGIGYAAHQSTPGDPLWGVSQTIFTDHSRSVQAAADVTAELAEAATALSAGTPGKARDALDRAKADLAAVGSGEGRQDLERRHSELEAQLAEVTAVAPAPTTPPTATPPAATTPGSTSTVTAPPATTATSVPPRPTTPTTTDASPSPTTTPDAPPTTTVEPTTPAPTGDTTPPAPSTDPVDPSTPEQPGAPEPESPTG